jgi:hypothetical protein
MPCPLVEGFCFFKNINKGLTQQTVMKKSNAKTYKIVKISKKNYNEFVFRLKEEAKKYFSSGKAKSEFNRIILGFDPEVNWQVILIHKYINESIDEKSLHLIPYKSVKNPKEILFYIFKIILEKHHNIIKQNTDLSTLDEVNLKLGELLKIEEFIKYAFNGLLDSYIKHSNNDFKIFPRLKLIENHGNWECWYYVYRTLYGELLISIMFDSKYDLFWNKLIDALSYERLQFENEALKKECEFYKNPVLDKFAKELAAYPKVREIKNTTLGRSPYLWKRSWLKAYAKEVTRFREEKSEHKNITQLDITMAELHEGTPDAFRRWLMEGNKLEQYGISHRQDLTVKIANKIADDYNLPD